jgi:hypothetical protein
MPRPFLLFCARVTLFSALAGGIYLATMSGGPAATGAINDKLAHLIGFYLLALLADLAFPRTHLLLVKSLPLMGYGVLIEILQFFIPYRSFSMLDLVADGAGLALYGCTVLVLERTGFGAWRVALAKVNPDAMA